VRAAVPVATMSSTIPTETGMLRSIFDAWDWAGKKVETD
jgi:hypothetical protein